MEFLDALTILFVALKLTGHIDWSWCVVLLPKVFMVVLEAVITVLEDKCARR